MVAQKQEAGNAFKDREKPAHIRASNITAAKGKNSFKFIHPLIYLFIYLLLFLYLFLIKCLFTIKYKYYTIFK